MKIHIKKISTDNTRCGRVIWRGSADVSVIYIPDDKIKNTKRGATCRNCIRSKS